MNTATIEELAYLIKQAKEEGLPQPIVFLGAGASKTGGIPLAREIIKDILEKYANNPKIKVLKDDSKTYPKLMECLTPFERNKLLKEYIDKAKINVTHIYLAQLLIEGYVDYVLTVNFDNLMLRALALFNNFPATYDMAILKDLTTTSFKEKSVVYLHGQHHGLWLLNTDEEMAKVKEIIPKIIDSIKNQRPWIFIGYSGEDPIFEHLRNIVRFDNGLYWVTYQDSTPNDTVCNDLLGKPNTNAHLIKGYDADSFMLKLNAELGLPQPLIIDKPFTSLKNTLENIVDIDDKEHFKGVKERLEIVKKDVNIAIKQFEEGKIDSNGKLQKELAISLLKKQIIDIIIKENFKDKKIKALEASTDSINNEEINFLMSELYNAWGISLYKKSKLKNDEKIYVQSFEKFKLATKLNPKNEAAFTNWGTSLSDLAKLKNNEPLYKQSFEKFKKAEELNSKNDSLYNNWGIAIKDLAKLKNDEKLYEQSFSKYKKAIELSPGKAFIYSNWGNSISDLAKLKNDKIIYEQSFEKFKKAEELNSKNDSAYNNWGIAIKNLAELTNDEKLFKESFSKYKKAVELNPANSSAFDNWGIALSALAKRKGDNTLFLESIEKFNRAIELGNSSYNLACVYALQNDAVKALEILENCLNKKERDVSLVIADSDWNTFLENPDFISLIQKYSDNK